MTTAKQVRDLLQTKVGDLIGTYKFSNGQTRPALFVRGSQQRPADVQVAGIEMVVDEATDDYGTPLVGAGSAVTQYWKITVTQYNRSATLSVVKSRLRWVFPDLMNVVHISQSDSMYEQLTCSIPDYALYPEIM